MRIRTLVALVSLGLAPAAFGQQQVVKPPIAVYWVSAATVSGFGAGMGAGGAAGMMGMMMGRGGGAQRTLDLRLGSSQAASGSPQAEHDIPPGLNMGPSLPLLTPVQAPTEPGGDLPQGMEQPKGRMLIYWGCGEKAGPGQPVVLDFANLAAGQRPPNLASRRIAGQVGPQFGRSKMFGQWPNQQDNKPVPADGSLKGDHTVRGNYSPEIRFAVDERRDFMPPVSLASSASAGGGRLVRWNSVSGATGYFMMAFGGKEDGSEVVMWSSSAVQEMGGALMDYIAPSEVARLVREKVVLPPDTTQCVVPVEVMKASAMPMLSFIAYGDELNVVHPPRPQDPKVAWEQQWAVKVRLKSTSMLPLADGMEMDPARMGGGSTREARPENAPADSQQGPGANPVDEGVRVLRGIFGR